MWQEEALAFVRSFVCTVGTVMRACPSNIVGGTEPLVIVEPSDKSWAWCHIPLVPNTGGLRQEDCCELKASQDYVVILFQKEKKNQRRGWGDSSMIRSSSCKQEDLSFIPRAHPHE